MKPRAWFRFQNQADDPSTVDIHIIDIIGDWIDDLINEYYGMAATVTAKAFVKQLSELPDNVKTIRLHINSPGGDVFGALNIANALRDQQTTKGRVVESYVDGLAASAASIVMMAGSKVCIADNALVMVHDPSSVAVGNSRDMRKMADTLDTIRNTIVATYQWHSSMSPEDLSGLLAAETWMSADEAIANGFATDKVEGLAAVACLDPRVIAKMKVPEQFKARVDALLRKEPPAPTVANAVDVITAVDAAGLGTAFAREVVAASLTMEQVTARITTAKDEKAQRETRASEIRAVCAAAKQPELADGYVNGGMSLADVRAHLITITAKLDKVEIDSNLSPDQASARTKPVIDTAAIYADRNARKVKE